MPNYNGTKRSLTLQVIKYENGVEVSTTTYNGLLAFTYNNVTYPLITNTTLQNMLGLEYGIRLVAFEAYVGSLENMTVSTNVATGYEPEIADGGMCPLPVDWRTITVAANVDAFGLVSGGGTFLAGATATVIATAKPGYKFDYWQYYLDGVAQANILTSTYQCVVTEDAAFTAVFSILVVTTYSVVFSNHVCQIVP